VRIYIWMVLVFALVCYAETLFEVKDASNNKVLDVSTDGLRILNQGDTLMVISTNEIRANISSSKGLSRTFSVTTNSAKGSGLDLMRLTSDSTRFWISDSGSGFGVSSQTAAKEKSVATNFLKVSNANTEMREGAAGNRYTDFSPENIFIGLNAGINTQPDGIWGISNIFIGNYSGYMNFNGADNIFIGDSTGVSNTSGFKNLFIGNNAGKNNTIGLSNLFLGQQAGESNQDGSFNMILGYGAGSDNISGSQNTYIGFSSGMQSTSSHNTFVGCHSGDYCREGEKNSFFGSNTGMNIKSGSENVFVGYESGNRMDSGNRNVFIGEGAGYWTPGGNNNVFIGNEAGKGVNSSLDSCLIIESGYTGSDNMANALIYGQFNNNKLRFNANTSFNTQYSETYGMIVNGGSSPNYSALFYKGAYTYGSFVSGSDIKWKKNILNLTGSLDKIRGLRGVSFNWKKDEYQDKGFTERSQIGLIAQEVEKVLPELVYTEPNGDKGVDYAKMTAVLIEAVKELDKKVNEIEELKKDLSEIKKILGKE